MSVEHLPPVAGGLNPCLNCPPIEDALDMDRVIAVGFGFAGVTKDHECVWQEPYVEDDEAVELWQVSDAEAAAKDDPDHDWRIVLDGPLHGETYQRQGEGRWVLVERNEGFA